MPWLKNKARVIIPVLLISGMLYCKVSSAYYGLGITTTYVLDKSQYPVLLKKYKPDNIYALYSGPAGLREDTITNYKKFVQVFPYVKGFRLIFKTEDHIDSAWQFDMNFRITDKAYNLDNGLLKIIAYDSTSKITDQFVYDYGEKLKEPTRGRPAYGIKDRGLPWLLRQYKVYDSYDRNNYAVGNVWMLSVGIDDYGPTQYATCKTDASSYVDFFKRQYIKDKSYAVFGTMFHEYVLLDGEATKEAILSALQDITAKAGYNDYFIFNFSGCSNEIKNDPVNGGTNFFPYDVVVNSQSGSGAGLGNRHKTDTTNPYKKCIPLRVLQEYIQLIPANNQLFISEAGPSGKFKTEFIKTLMQNSSEVAGILNKNRVIIVPNDFGYENVNCLDKLIRKGPINYYITSLDTSLNIYDIFKGGKTAEELAFSIKNKSYTCKSFDFSYFDIFFEKKFLQEYNEIFGEASSATRGLKKERSKEIEKAISSLTGRHYALVVGMDTYKGEGWNNLSNPVKDAQAVAEELANSYGFDVQFLANKPMDTIYKALMEYYRIAKPNDQLVIYFAGHGDVDEEVLSDGFIVCTDSKSVQQDPVRNTYIPYDKLKRMLNNIPAKQVLVLLDVCHGGTFDANAFTDTKREGGLENISNRNVLQFLKDKLPLRTRKFLSSVGSEPAFDGKAGRHSPFANLLLQVLRARGNGSNGIVTLTDINAVLQTASLNETATLKISPHMADFGTVDAFSEFIFIPIEK